MIEAKRRKGWRFLIAWIACVVAIIGVGSVLLEGHLAHGGFGVLVLVCMVPTTVLYWPGLYCLVKARGRHGANALWGLLTLTGWVVIALLEDRAKDEPSK